VLALHPLAVVLEVGLRPAQAVEVLVPLLLRSSKDVQRPELGDVGLHSGGGSLLISGERVLRVARR
jgi:hypothetical protein